MQLAQRRALFISHANPEDNTFTVWLAAKLAALGYDVWADVLRLRGGQDWQRRLEQALRDEAVKVLLVGTPTAVDKQGVRNEIQIAHDVAKGIGDQEFIVPLRLAPFDAPFLIAHAQYIDFSRGWAGGLVELLDTLENTYKVPRVLNGSDTKWQGIQTLHATSLRSVPETLSSNWTAISALPKKLRYIEFRKNASVQDLEFRMKTSPKPAVKFGDGCISFASAEELSGHFGLDTLRPKLETGLESYVDKGWRPLNIDRQIALSHFSDLTRQGLEHFFHNRGLNGYELSSGRFGWWAPVGVAPVGKVSFKWNGVSGLRKIQGASIKRGFNWHFGVTANARIWPTRHVRFTSRLIFTEDGVKAVDDPGRMHRLRRSFAKSWRNPRWRDMLLAFLYWLAEGRDELAIPMAAEQWMIVRLPPLRFVAPVGIPQELDSAETDDDEGLEESYDEFDASEDEDFEGEEIS
jgi:hypothetical protein